MPKLVMYSDQTIPENERIDRLMLELIGKPKPKIGYIPSSGFTATSFYGERKAYYRQLGANLAINFDLDLGFYPDLLPELLECDAIHLSGGNTFYFLQRLRARKLLAPLHNYVMSGGVLIGVSAGAILMTPSIDTSILCGDAPPEGLSARLTADMGALGLVSFHFLPHYNPELTPNEKIQSLSRRVAAPVYACRDGDGVIVYPDHVETIGDVLLVDG